MEYEKDEAKNMSKNVWKDMQTRKYTAPRENTDEGPTT